MFKKTLLALALTGLAGTAAAATINTDVTYSAEGIANEATFSLSPEVSVGVAGAYSVGDKVVFTFPNDTLDISTVATLALADGTEDTSGVNDLSPAVTFSAPAYSNGNTITFTVSAIDTAAAGAVESSALETGNTVTLNGVVLQKGNLIDGGKVSLDYKAVSAVNNSDYEVKSGVIAKSENQFKAEVAQKFDAVIDVNEERKLFSADPKTTDTLEVKVTNTNTLTLPASLNVAAATKVTVNGDFSFLDTDADGTADYGVAVEYGTGPATDISGDVVIAEGMQSMSFPIVTSTETYKITVTASDDTTPTSIPVQAYTADVSLSYDSNTLNTGGTDSVKTFTGLEAGEWTLNGASGEVAFLPFGDDYARSITVANTSNLEGEITVDLTANGETYSKTLTSVKAAANSVTNISAAVNELAAENMITGNANVKVIVNAPKTAVSVTGVYYHKASADRILVPTKAGE